MEKSRHEQKRMFKWRRRKGYSQLDWYKFTMTWWPFCVCQKARGAGNASIKFYLNHRKSAWWITWHEVLFTLSLININTIKPPSLMEEIRLIASLNSPQYLPRVLYISGGFFVDSFHHQTVAPNHIPTSWNPPPPPPRGEVGLPEMGGTGRFGFTLK